jgi:PAS domain S-box-containing protein
MAFHSDFFIWVLSFFIMILGCSFLFLRMRFVRPLRLIRSVLDNNDETAVRKLSSVKGQFGQIVNLIVRAAQQKKELENEIAERKRVENSLRESEERYRNVVETSPDIILVMDLSANILIGNIRAATLFDITESVLVENLRSFLHQSEQENFKRILDNVIRIGRIHNVDCIMLKKDGRSFNAEISLSLLKTAMGDPKNIMAIIKDVTDLKSAEIEKARFEEQFRTIYKMEAVGQLAGGIAHDFNNILGAISGYADIILHRYGSDEKLKKYSSMILSAATRAADLTSKLLTFSRKSKMQLTAIDVHTILNDMRDLLMHTIDKKITIKASFEATDAVINGDASQFQSAVMNLALNSRDAMPDGGVLTIRTGNHIVDKEFSKSRAYTVAPGYYVFIEVGDTGTGIDEQLMPHLFEPFFTTKDIGKGTGLGLASVYGTVKSHRGYIDVKSRKGEGTTFIMYLPVSRSVLDQSSVQSSEIQMGKGHIIVVDDERFILEATAEMLSWIGYRVSLAQSGDAALDIVKAETVDLMIIDLMMPGMNGIETYKKVKTINPRIKALLSTGYKVDDEEQAIMNEGFSAIIQKPFVSAQLAQIVYDTLN